MVAQMAVVVHLPFADNRGPQLIGEVVDCGGLSCGSSGSSFWACYCYTVAVACLMQVPLW